MDIKEKYQQLLKNENKTLYLIDKVKTLRDQCVMEQNNEYFYLCNLLIVDIYIDNNEYDEAINILNKDISNFDSITFKNIYVSYLERIIYLYIKKRNFRVAYRYVFEKRKYIDEKDRDAVNRWYLEMAYVYAELGEKQKALLNLKAILENLPDEILLSHTLSNLTKLYIDQDMLVEAKQSLNECLKVTTDEEGIKYCDYLLAQIFVKEKNYDDALQLYKELFANDITEDYLSMAVDYVDLLINLEKYTEANEILNRIKEKVKIYEDINIQKILLQQELRIILCTNKLDKAQQVLQDIVKVDEQINRKNSLSFGEGIEDVKNNEVNVKINKLANDLLRIINFTNIIFDSNNIRDIFMEFSKKIASIVDIEEISYVVFDKVLPSQKPDELISYEYKKERLYEKIVPIDEVKGTIIETILVNNNEVILDLNDYNIEIRELNTKKTYQEKGFRSVYAIPFHENSQIFMVFVFKAMNLEMAETTNLSLLRVASKLLDMKFINLFTSEKLRIADFTNNLFALSNRIYSLYHYDKVIVVNNELKKLLDLSTNEIDITDFSKKMLKNERNAYLEYDFHNGNEQQFKYHLLIDNKYHRIIENALPYSSQEDRYFISSLEVYAPEEFSYDDEKFYERIEELKSKCTNVNFKFSFIRINAPILEYGNLQSLFSHTIYYLSDNTFCAILENEVNQKVIDKYIKDYQDRVTVIRYPRDLINIEEIITFSKDALASKMLYFDDEIYQKYLKKLSIEHLVEKNINKEVKVCFLTLHAYNQKRAFEIRPLLNGINEKDNLRSFLDCNTLTKLDTELYINFIVPTFKDLYFIFLTSESLHNLIKKEAIKNNSNLFICVDTYSSTLKEDLNIIRRKGIKVLLDYKLLKMMNIIDFSEMMIDGVVIGEGINMELRRQILNITTKYNLIIYTNYEYKDYKLCIYRTEKVALEIEDE